MSDIVYLVTSEVEYEGNDVLGIAGDLRTAKALGESALYASEVDRVGTWRRYRPAMRKSLKLHRDEMTLTLPHRVIRIEPIVPVR